MTTTLFTAGSLSGTDDGPLYLRLQSMIRSGIAEGRLRPNDALPAERDLAAHLGVSRVTVRKALRGLVDEGVLRQRHGSGTFVSRGADRIEQPLTRLTSFTEDIRATGRVPGTRWLDRSTGLPSGEEAAILGLSPTTRVSRLVRLRLVDGDPIAIEAAVVPANAISDPMRVEASLYDALAATGMHPVRAVQRMTAVSLGGAEAALLGVAPGAAAVAIERIAYLPDGSVIEFTRSHYRGDACDFVAELSLASQADGSQAGPTMEG
ncbi:GntR family transcriptional regulator [Mesorhizobium sp. BR1-1-16]|uniref:GntR family transcriptional regulator n=1 Tax=Mesorhizobium sp. BR1-1-16 TaxID=2876653 RepID=UPI001CCCA4C0|nr:GntR family transcriptional regulator [Mesorhizobium sp. BR1-1-16]MBZ9937738.1 GntR family transcriptional regulator [Mesorhizobium sp. BR1-1-16]